MLRSLEFESMEIELEVDGDWLRCSGLAVDRPK